MIVDEFDYRGDEIYELCHPTETWHYIEISFPYETHNESVENFHLTTFGWDRDGRLMNTHKRSDSPFVATIRTMTSGDLISKAWVAWCAIEKGLE